MYQMFTILDDYCKVHMQYYGPEYQYEETTFILIQTKLRKANSNIKCMDVLR